MDGHCSSVPEMVSLKLCVLECKHASNNNVAQTSGSYKSYLNT